MTDAPLTIPKLREPEYPETHARKYLSDKQRAELCLKQHGKCAGCKIKPRHGWEYDHIIELWEGGTNDAANFQAFGSARDCKCHVKKTRAAAARRAKMRRLRGETGQRARRERRGHSSIQGRKEIAGRGFNKAKTRGFDGKVRDRV